MKKNKRRLSILSLILVCAMALHLSGCGATVQAADLMQDIGAQSVAERPMDAEFLASQMELALKLFRASAQESREENILISPLSIQLALAMAANGAKGQTLEEMESLLGGGSIAQLNEYLHTYVSGLPSAETMKLQIANAIWFRDDESRLQIDRHFLQTNADYYGAQAYKAPFDEGTVKQINHWVNTHTDGMIPTLLNSIDPSTLMYLINAVAFDARWMDVYTQQDVQSGTFTAFSGQKQDATLMHSKESLYIRDGKATGFIKPYAGGDYSFAALLPGENQDIYDYIASLTPSGLQEMLKNAQSCTVYATMPKFSYAYGWSMNQALDSMGMGTALDPGKADLSGMGSSGDGALYIGQVLHKTFIAVDELGTKAGAVTAMKVCGSAPIETYYEVQLDRPFVYMILDNATNLPVFIGALVELP